MLCVRLLNFTANRRGEKRKDVGCFYSSERQRRTAEKNLQKLRQKLTRAIVRRDSVPMTR